MSRPTIPMRGTWGRLTIIDRADPPAPDLYGFTRPGAWWNCVCSCGTRVKKLGVYLRDGSTKSCGCLPKDNARQRLVDYRARKDLSA